MRTPRRYRLAVLAYPAGYRATRGRELLSTLADGDDDRGGPSTREALALAYRGLLQRLRIAVSGEGLLTIAAGLVLFTAVCGLTWAERTFLFEGDVAASSWEGPGRWWGVALVMSAFAALAAGPFDAADDPRRRRRAALLAFPLALLVLGAPLGIFKHMVPTPVELADYLWWMARAIVANWTIFLPSAGAVSAGTWAALTIVSRLRPLHRLQVLAGALACASAGAVTVTWDRPDLVAEYGQSAFTDLGSGVFVTAAAALLALAASGRAHRST